MSTVRTAIEPRPTRNRSGFGRLRIGALGFLGILTLTYVAILFSVTSVVAGTRRLTIVVVLSFVTALWLADSLDHRDAALLAGGFALIGFVIYILSAPGIMEAMSGIGGLIRDILALLSGHTVLSILAVDLWALAVAPAPIFLSWYFALREHYAEAAAVGLALLIFFVLSGDASTTQTMIGVMGAGGAVGFGQLSKRDASVGEADLVVLLLAAMLVTSLAISVVPGGGASPVTPGIDTESETFSSEAALLGHDGELSISGEPTLDPTVRYTITAEEPMNWRVDAFDRYTGDGWVQTGEDQPFEAERGLLGGERVELTVQAEVDGVTVMPAQWRPHSVSGVDDVLQSPADGLLSAGGLEEGQEYVVVSEQPNATTEELRNAGTEYPSSIEERYTQLPETLPDRVGGLTANLTADDDSPYEAAETIEQFIIDTNDYSLDVDVPDGDIADAQLFERNEGYCIFFATTMVAMLRTQDIPARMVTGYSSGERIDEDRWVVRGMNAHAWVEIYVPEVGWVAFDPTPSGPYNDARETAIEDAREDGIENVDTDETGGEPWTPDPADENGENVSDGSDDTNASVNGSTEMNAEILCENPEAVQTGLLTEAEARELCTPAQTAAMGIGPGASDRDPLQDYDVGQYQDEMNVGEATEDDEPLLPTEHIILAVALLVGGIAGARRTKIPDRIRYSLGVHWQGRAGDSTGTIERAWERLETYLEATYGGRRSGETVRTYVERLDAAYSIDDRIVAVAETYERARYSPAAVEPETARQTVAAVDAVVGTRIPRFWA